MFQCGVLVIKRLFNIHFYGDALKFFEEFLRFCHFNLLRRRKIFVMLNMLFFDSLFLGVLMGQFLYFPSFNVDLSWLYVLDWHLMMLTIFAWNFILGGIISLVLPGFAFFPFSAALLIERGFSWGVMLSRNPIVSPFSVLVFALEGEGYVLAAMAGTLLGLSWLRPNWIYKDGLSRLDALKTASKEALRFLLISAITLLLGAIVETLAIKGV
jgi:hypothetical protein